MKQTKNTSSEDGTMMGVASADKSVSTAMGSSTGGEETQKAGTESNASSTEAGEMDSSKKMREKGTAPLEKFFTDQLKDIYYAEQQLTKAIPKMEAAATTEELKEAFNDHLHQTQKQIRRLDKVFRLIGKKAEGKKCEAIEGLVKETESIISDTEEGSMTRDAALIIAAQKVEHYEIATYGGLVQLALTMGLDEVADILDTTLMEEEDTDLLLTDIAEGHINMEAENEGANYSWAEEETEEEGETADEEESVEE